MTIDLIIWPSSYIPLQNVLSEIIETKLHHDFNVEVIDSEIANPDFLMRFAWTILAAKLRPQIHVILIDNNKLSFANKINIFKNCTCALDFVSTHPMKYLVFYDLVNFNNSPRMDMAMHLSYKLQKQTENLSSFARVHIHQGHQLHPDTDFNQVLNHNGLVKLAQSILHLACQIISKIND